MIVQPMAFKTVKASLVEVSIPERHKATCANTMQTTNPMTNHPRNFMSRPLS